MDNLFLYILLNSFLANNPQHITLSKFDEIMRRIAGKVVSGDIYWRLHKIRMGFDRYKYATWRKVERDAYILVTYGEFGCWRKCLEGDINWLACERIVITTQEAADDSNKRMTELLKEMRKYSVKE